MEEKEVILTPKQEMFLERYTNPKSPTFGNALQSALAAGFSQTYSENIMGLMPEWLLENIGDMRRLKRAERNLTEIQELDIYTEGGKPDPQIIEKRSKVDMFLLEALDKKKYSKRSEITGEDGKAINIVIADAIARKNNITPSGSNTNSELSQ